MSSSPTFIRFIGPNGAARSVTANGRTYSVAAGGTVDVPFADAWMCGANGFCEVCGSGTTAQRPASPGVGQAYHDNTLALIIVFEGGAWRNPASGALV